MSDESSDLCAECEVNVKMAGRDVCRGCHHAINRAALIKQRRAEMQQDDARRGAI